jgi:hypothetical protein
MLMVMFGAGATHGSISSPDAAAQDYRLEPPPLADQLLSPRYGGGVGLFWVWISTAAFSVEAR